MNQGLAVGDDDPLWDGRAEITVGRIILRYLGADPPAGESRVADGLRCWANELICDGQARLAEAGHPYLRAVG